MARVVLVGLVDDRGWVLLQERDSQAPVDPDRRTLPGGAVEPASRWRTRRLVSFSRRQG